MNFLFGLAGGKLNKEGVLVGPAVDYSQPEVEVKVDERGGAFWAKAG